MKTHLVWSAVVLCAIGCGGCARQAATTWGYSHWYDQGGAGSMGAFEEKQKQCLERTGLAGEAASVAPNSQEEDAFIQCMNASGWCTTAFDCDKPGA